MLVESLVARFRYLDETIAVVLGLVGVKLLVEDLVKVGPVASLAVIAVAFTIGIVLSLRADWRDPDAEEQRQERVEAMQRGRLGAEGGSGAAPLGGDASAARQLPLEAAEPVVPLGRPPRPSSECLRHGAGVGR